MRHRWPTRTELLRSTDEVFHCYNRGVDRQQIFHSNEYYSLFLSLVERFHDTEALRILAYCLMPNHVHFLFRQLKAYAVSRFMENVCRDYAITVNHACARVGHLFQQRYGLKWVWRPVDIPLLATYVHQNPVRAGLVLSSDEWMFSSCREYLGLRTCGYLHLDDVLSNLDGAADYRSYLVQRTEGVEFLPSRSRFDEGPPAPPNPAEVLACSPRTP